MSDSSSATAPRSRSIGCDRARKIFPGMPCQAHIMAVILVRSFVARPTEYGPLQKYDFEAKGDWDIVARDFADR